MDKSLFIKALQHTLDNALSAFKSQKFFAMYTIVNLPAYRILTYFCH